MYSQFLMDMSEENLHGIPKGQFGDLAMGENHE
jgi:hypothetical protein